MQAFCRSALLREQIPVHVDKPLEFQRVTTGVQQKECALLARLPGKTPMRFDHKGNAEPLQTLGLHLPLDHVQHQTEVRYWNHVTIHRIAVSLDAPTIFHFMDHQLVTMEIEVHPMGGAATFRQPQHIPIEGACGRKVMNRNRQMKWTSCLHPCSLRLAGDRRGT